MGTLTPNLGLTIPTISGDAGPAFAEEINGDLSIIDSIYGGVNAINIGGNANVTLTSTQAQNMVQQFTGILTGNITVFAPAVGGFYAVENATTGNFSLAFGCAGGGNVQIIPQGLSTWLWTDGSFTRLSNPPGWQEIATYTASNAANLVILLPAPFRRFRLTMDFTVASAGAALCATMSINGGTSYVTSGYDTNALVYFASTVFAANAVSASFILTVGNGLGVPYDGTVEIYPGSPGFAGTYFRSSGIGMSQTQGAIIGENRAGTNGNTPAANAMSLFPDSGNIAAGTFILEGLP